MRDVSVIVPTRALTERADLIRRAIRTILEQEGVSVVPIVVVNGTMGDPQLLDELRANTLLRLVYRDQANLPAALKAGREIVTTQFVTSLDDDDELLPGALLARVSALEANPGWQAVVSNGMIRNGRSMALKFSNVNAIRQDPVRAMMRGNWLLPGAWLCRTEVIGPEVFAGMPEFLECTYLGYWLATRTRLGFLETPTLVWGKDTPASASKSLEYVLGQAAAHRQLLTLALPPDVIANLRRRVSGSCHSASRACLERGRYAAAWAWHLRALREFGGMRYLVYTLRLLRPY